MDGVLAEDQPGRDVAIHESVCDEAEGSTSRGVRSRSRRGRRLGPAAPRVRRAAGARARPADAPIASRRLSASVASRTAASPRPSEASTRVSSSLARASSKDAPVAANSSTASSPRVARLLLVAGGGRDEPFGEVQRGAQRARSYRLGYRAELLEVGSRRGGLARRDLRPHHQLQGCRAEGLVLGRRTRERRLEQVTCGRGIPRSRASWPRTGGVSGLPGARGGTPPPRRRGPGSGADRPAGRSAAPPRWAARRRVPSRVGQLTLGLAPPALPGQDGAIVGPAGEGNGVRSHPAAELLDLPHHSAAHS